MKQKIEHIDHKFLNVKYYGFFVYNRFGFENSNLILDDVIKSDALNEDYFDTKEELLQREKQLNQLLENARKEGALIENEDTSIEVYGPLLKSQIISSDFTKLNYEDYNKIILSYVKEWKNKGWKKSSDALLEFHEYSLIELNIESMSKREYYFLDSELMDSKKLIEINYYDYFFTVISTLNNSNQVIIMNFGND